MPVQVVYETHSTTLDNEAGIATGWLPGELSAEGRRQARELGERRRHDGVDAVFSSDLARAVETVRIAFHDSGIPCHQDRRLRECNYGRLNGAAVEALRPRTAYVDRPFPGGQSYRDVVEQTGDFLADLADRFDGQRVVLVSHSAGRWALQCLLRGARLEDLVDEPFDWQPGWDYSLPGGWRGSEA